MTERNQDDLFNELIEEVEKDEQEDFEQEDEDGYRIKMPYESWCERYGREA